LRAQIAQAGGDPAQVSALAETYFNLDFEKPLWRQYLEYIASILQGDLGQSLWYQEPVASLLGEAIPWTLLVMSISILFTFVIGLFLGAVMAYREGSSFDYASTVTTLLLNSIPYYVVALVFLFYFGYSKGLFPTGGRSPSVEAGFTVEFIAGILYHAALPSISFIITAIGGIALRMRGNSISVLGSDYLRVARLRGLSSNRIAHRYVLRNSVLPMYTQLMLSIGFMFVGVIVLETIFSYRGVGFYMFE
jgi:peptide/nickel transport system permease protein